MSVVAASRSEFTKQFSTSMWWILAIVLVAYVGFTAAVLAFALAASTTGAIGGDGPSLPADRSSSASAATLKLYAPPGWAPAGVCAPGRGVHRLHADSARRARKGVLWRPRSRPRAWPTPASSR